jgi:hypothetical protein
MGIGGLWELTALVWLEGMGVTEGRVMGIEEANSPVFLPWGEVVIEARLGVRFFFSSPYLPRWKSAKNPAKIFATSRENPVHKSPNRVIFFSSIRQT